MGTISTNGTADTAPEYHCNSLGTPCWSGLPAKDFTLELELELRLFINIEAKRRGHNDKVANKYDPEQRLFDPHFLNGWPAKAWALAYDEGYNH
ncbi:hypothetical protein [Photobacterium sp. GB-72]|uniref:hypothetical protein n=1 Tax=Photobacterium sp. GB-72 TaxID=2022105 RepID=UPI000D157CD6|nr:hypothetical protein [Photobacterium sp. GB-72]PSV26066.1 hypothetical protein C9J40_21640 [Photobacterium sp. GB-72]